MVETIKKCNYEGLIGIALDVAASGNDNYLVRGSKTFLEFHLESKPGFYDLDKKSVSKSNHRILSGDELVDYYLSLIQKYPSNLI